MIPTIPLTRSLSLLLGPLALLLALLCLGTTSAHACPAGTVFSAYNGNAMCAYVGQGATAAVHCTKMVNSCPPGTTHEHKTRGDTGDYCCPSTISKATAQNIECVWRGRAPACDGSCLYGEEEQTRAANENDAGKVRPYRGVAFGAECLSGSKALCCHYTGPR
jgi:hypothetical protein